MEVTIELQNLGDEQLCREISARSEHAFADRRGAWRVSIIGSRASETWAINFEGPNAFERSYSLAKGAGQHEPDAIGRLILQLLPGSPS